MLSLAVALAIGCDASSDMRLFASAANPTADIAPGAYLFAQSVELSCETDGAVIHYTTDGSEPTESSPVYSDAIAVDQASVTIKALAVSDDYKSSDVVEFTYEIGFKYGAIGPAGGYVFYDCDADNDSGNADGLDSATCGWRYLEAAPADIAVGSTTSFVFGYYRKSQSGTNRYVNGTTSYVAGTSDANDGKSTGTVIGTGRANTTKLVTCMESAAYTSYSGADTTADYAARLCDDYTCGGYSDWFLPSKDEFNVMYTNLYLNGLGNFSSDYYWSSSESSDSSSFFAWYQGGMNRNQVNNSRSFRNRVRAVRAFLDAGDNTPSAPNASVASGSYRAIQTVELSCNEDDVTIYYTVDGTDPTFNGTKYTGSGIEVSYELDDQQTVLKAVARNRKGDYSSISEYTYVILGPAGGYVFYDCDADNSSGNTDGLTSATCGWRYLESAPADITVDYSSEFVFGFYKKNQNGQSLYVNDSTAYEEGAFDADDGKSTGTAIGTGKANTTKLVARMESAAYTDDSGAETTADYAAKLCDDYTCGGYSDWFLPSFDELDLMYENLRCNYLGGFSLDYYWSSSESEMNPTVALDQSFLSGNQSVTGRTGSHRVRAVRAF